MVKEELVIGLKNAINRGESLEKAMQSLLTAGYSPIDVKEASEYINLGVTKKIAQNVPQENPQTPQTNENEESQKYLAENKPFISKEKIPTPTGIKIISIFFYLVCASLLMLGLLCFIGAGFISSMLGNSPIFESVASYFNLIIIGLGIILLTFSICYLLTAIFLWKGRKKAKIAALILTILSLVISLLVMISTNIINNLLGFVINIAILIYLIFNNNSKNFFDQEMQVIQDKSTSPAIESGEQQKSDIKPPPIIQNSLPQRKTNILLPILVILAVIILGAIIASIFFGEEILSMLYPA
jgi:lysylphosphatidylglycerol synthetase-like protein (DUF2156 family)